MNDGFVTLMMLILVVDGKLKKKYFVCNTCDKKRIIIPYKPKVIAGHVFVGVLP